MRKRRHQCQEKNGVPVLIGRHAVGNRNMDNDNTENNDVNLPSDLSLLDAAIYLVSAGFSVFPVFETDPHDPSTCSCSKGSNCSSPAKHPRISGGFKNATLLEADVEDWWHQWPRANIGVKTGADTGVFVLDVDPGHGGDASLATLQEEYGELPATLTQQTGSGGQHFFFNHPGGAVPNSAGKIGPGLDIRGDGGYIIVGPSRNTSGPYNVESPDGTLQRELILDAPDWLIQLVRQAPTSCSTTLASCPTTTAPGMIGPGGRNETLTSLAGTMRNRGMSQAAIFAALQAENTQRFDPPLDDAEVASIAASISSYDPAGGPCQASLPIVCLPGHSKRVTDTSVVLADLLANRGGVYTRSGMPVVARQSTPADAVELRVLKPAAMISLFEDVARLVKLNAKGEQKAAVCSEPNAKAILECEAFVNGLPIIEIVTRTPVLVERADGTLVQVTGYDAESRILASEDVVPEVPLEQAVQLLKNMLADFDFGSDADRSRALASLVTPSLVHGGLLDGRPAADVGEANDSQAGKGYRNKLICAIYNLKAKIITQGGRGGVGSIDEAFDQALINGDPFIILDNVRGKIDSKKIEAALTEDRVNARVPYHGNIDVDPRRIVFFMTSNKAELTPDLANRSSFIRIQKHPPGYEYQVFEEGDILAHVRANQALYLGAVFAVAKAWHEAGKPRTDEARHDFRAWAQSLDWIVQNIFDEAPLMDGHGEIKERVVNPAINWVRDVALAVQEHGSLNIQLRAHQLLDLIVLHGGIEIPGCDEGADIESEDARSNANRAIGRRISQFLAGTDRKVVEGYEVQRITAADTNYHETKLYRFRRLDDLTPFGGTPQPTSDDPPEGGGDFDSPACGGYPDEPMLPPAVVTVGGG